MKATITLPWPHKALSPNSRAHRMVAAPHRRKARNDGFYASIAGGASSLRGAGSLSYRVIAHPPTNRRRDADNILASLKSYLDGVGDHIGIDDSKWRLDGVTFGGAIKPGFVLVEIEAPARAA
jgi:crossover junction endodeoxyribonuclease RusA